MTENNNNTNTLEMVKYADRVGEILRGRKPAYSKSAMNLMTYIERAFDGDEDVLGIVHRIKTEESLKEKVYRKGLYKLYDEEELFMHISDIIGVKIDCRFLENEIAIYEKLKKMFCVHAHGLYYRAEDNTDIFLKMGSVQPETQKNSYKIYRLDGYVQVGETQRFRFELQIKSLVNGFWSEIEHKIIYKNKKYLLIDSFITELMSSIHDSLQNIDRQLSMLYHRALDNTSDSYFDHNKNLLTMILNLVYTEIVEQKLGVAINIKEHCDTLVSYIVNDSSFSGDGAEYGGLILKLINRMKDIRADKIDIGNEIDAGIQLYKSSNDIESVIAKKVIEVLNTDFYVNTFFHILFHIEIGNEVEDFISFISYYASRISHNKTPQQQQKLVAEIEKIDAVSLLKEDTIKFLEKTIF